MNLPYELIIFDLGNVLLDYDHRITCRKLSNFSKPRYPAGKMYHFLFNNHSLSRQYDQGKITTEEFFKTLVDKFSLKITFKEFTPIWNDIFRENKAVSQLVRNLKRRYRIYLISNTNEMHLKYLAQKFNILSEFDRIFASYALGLGKPNRLIFELALKDAQVKPGKAIFIDDIPEHITTASALGLKAIQFTGIKRLKRQLYDLNVLN